LIDFSFFLFESYYEPLQFSKNTLEVQTGIFGKRTMDTLCVRCVVSPTPSDLLADVAIFFSLVIFQFSSFEIVDWRVARFMYIAKSPYNRLVYDK
jgi:hypothetical protein